MRVQVRQATVEDASRCFAITEDAMRGYVEATWGRWDPAAQWEAHLQSFSPATHWLVFAGARLAGLVAAELHAAHVQLVKLYVASQHRSRGIGAVLPGSLSLAASARGQPLRLRVLAVNTRAQAFYARHGFREVFRTIERVFMEASPNRSVEATSKSTLRVLSAAPHRQR